MELLHTLEEIIHFDKLDQLSNELAKLGIKYQQQDVTDLSNKYKQLVKIELDKYNSYIDTICKAPPAKYTESKEYRNGRIEENFYFNSYSESVRCNFRYSSGGFDTHAILELK